MINCTHAFELAPTGYFENCTELHIRGETICGCEEPKNPLICSLCKEGSIPDPAKKIGDKTCEEWEKKAEGRFLEDCPTWQQTFGIACGYSKFKYQKRGLLQYRWVKKIVLENNQHIMIYLVNAISLLHLHTPSSAPKLVGRCAFISLLSVLFVGMI